MTMNSDLNFREIIPQLAGLYRQGLLVPFVGAGMSRGVCCGWEDLLKNLALATKVSLPATTAENKFRSSDIIRLADEIVSTLRPYKIAKQIAIYQKALLATPKCKEIPAQAKELSKLYWPLVITTNYDDVLWTAMQKEGKNPNIDILGRSVEDCHAILHSLDEVSSPMHWAIQGFLGGQLTAANKIIGDTANRNELANQIVLGHQQYQKAINTAVHFRRAFAEVFRRRSFLFLGSGILEDYLVNLFSEILHNQGCGPYPHFALLKRSEIGRYDNLFMQQRLGIVPIFYDDHADLPKNLREFSDLIRFWLSESSSPIKQVVPFIFQDEIGFKLSANASRGTVPVKVNICKAVVPLPDPKYSECSVVSVGRYDNSPKIGTQADSHVKAFEEKFGIDPQSWIKVDEAPSYVFRYGASAIFGIAARRRDTVTRNHDTRDLGIIPDALCALLLQVDAAGFETVHIGPIAAGKHRPWHPIHPFAQSMCGIRKFLADHEIKHIKRINFYVVDPATWSAIISRKILVDTLLTSDISTHTIKTTDASGVTESFSFTLKESPSLEQLLKLCKIDPDLWNISVFPLPVEQQSSITADSIITPTMRLILTAK